MGYRKERFYDVNWPTTYSYVDVVIVSDGTVIIETNGYGPALSDADRRKLRDFLFREDVD